MQELIENIKVVEDAVAQGAPNEFIDESVQEVAEAEARLGGLLRRFQDVQSLTTDQIQQQMMASTKDKTIKEVWHCMATSACEEHRYIASAQATWEPIIMAAAGQIQMKEAARRWQSAA